MKLISKRPIKKPIVNKPAKVLHPPVNAASEYAEELQKLVREVYRALVKELKAAPVADGSAFVPTLDAGTSYIDRLMRKLTDRFEIQFSNIGQKLATDLVTRTNEASTRSIKNSLREVSKDLTIGAEVMTGPLAGAIHDAVSDNVKLIKRIPANLLASVRDDVVKSLAPGGGGLSDLLPKLQEAYKGNKRRAELTAMDQTRKAFKAINVAKMGTAGQKKFEWIHSGGSDNPRPYHMHRWPNGLNGGIFSVDEPPIINEDTGERGLPGDEPYCRCNMRFIISFDDESQK